MLLSGAGCDFDLLFQVETHFIIAEVEVADRNQIGVLPESEVGCLGFARSGTETVVPCDE